MYIPCIPCSLLFHYCEYLYVLPVFTTFPVLCVQVCSFTQHTFLTPCEKMQHEGTLEVLTKNKQLLRWVPSLFGADAVRVRFARVLLQCGALTFLLSTVLQIWCPA